MHDQANAAQSLANAVSIPVRADADTGCGNALSTFHIVRRMEPAGAAGPNIDDQKSPTRCCHIYDKSLIPGEEMVRKARDAAAGAEVGQASNIV
ncbi:isocitrate lyase/phosphoenolpyruvate mutase family protein [Azospirillum sp. A29]|uniref:isocitrate lyase/phosphoenolpyruvate mutase family protein n=1 Tax=Azospirillum sp. A29 TaxID=3160606 RepID=UPI00366EDFED